MKRFIILFALFTAWPPAASLAECCSVELKVGAGVMYGDTTYGIGGQVYTPGGGVENIRFPLSELEFPLDVYMDWAKGRVTLFDRIQVWGMVKHSFSEDAGKMEDSDWGINYYELEGWDDQGSLDIFSRSEARLDAISTDAGLRVRLYDDAGRIAYWLGVGHIHQKLDFALFDVDQWYPSLNQLAGEDVGHDRIGGLVGTYHVTYNIPYLELSTTALINRRFSAEVRIGYSPTAYAHDEDEHLLRDKNSYGDAHGHALVFALEARYHFMGYWFADLQLDLLNVYTEGTQVQYADRAFDATIDLAIESRQMFAGLGLGCRF